MDNQIELRPIGAEDEPFLFTVYANTRYEELAQVAWSQKEKEIFLRQQFQFQHSQYMENYLDAEFKIIKIDDVDAGRLYSDVWKKEIRIIDIAILPEYRNRGCGTVLIKEIQEKAASQDKKVSIHVEKNNPALGLYHRLGFKETEDKEVYWLLEWEPVSTDK